VPELHLARGPLGTHVEWERELQQALPLVPVDAGGDLQGRRAGRERDLLLVPPVVLVDVPGIPPVRGVAKDLLPCRLARRGPRASRVKRARGFSSTTVSAKAELPPRNRDVTTSSPSIGSDLQAAADWARENHVDQPPAGG
jgi:hypothetical protein